MLQPGALGLDESCLFGRKGVKIADAVSVLVDKPKNMYQEPQFVVSLSIMGLHIKSERKKSMDINVPLYFFLSLYFLLLV